MPTILSLNKSVGTLRFAHPTKDSDSDIRQNDKFIDICGIITLEISDMEAP